MEGPRIIYFKDNFFKAGKQKMGSLGIPSAVILSIALTRKSQSGSVIPSMTRSSRFKPGYVS